MANVTTDSGPLFKAEPVFTRDLYLDLDVADYAMARAEVRVMGKRGCVCVQRRACCVFECAVR